jgi:1-acyl-sn-glycerol-3-phosphate acyltransferase
MDHLEPCASSHSSSKGSLAYRTVHFVAGKAMRIFYRVDVQGADNLPEEGPLILAANHRSFMDSVFLALTSPRPIAFVAKAEYFDRPVTRWMVRRAGAIPLRRGSPAGARQALEAASDVLAGGGTLAIYPEGTRSRDGKLHRGKRGPARLALTTGAAIVPVGLIGTEAVQSPDERVPRPFRRVVVRFGSARRLAAGGGEDGKRRVRDATDELMHDIAALSGQEYASPVAAGS